MEFAAPKSRQIKIINAILLVAFIGSAVGFFLVDRDIWSLIVPLGVMLFVFGLSYYFSIRKFQITDDEIIIVRPFDIEKYPRSNFDKAERVCRKDLRFAIRTFGIGGVFSYTGQFWNKKFGPMTWYVTNLNNAVILSGANKKIVLSPENPEKFISKISG